MQFRNNFLLLTASLMFNYAYSANLFDIRDHPNNSLLPLETCGESYSERIVGGQVASLGEFPWMALIIYKVRDCPLRGHSYNCAGSLITETVVVTAAHCVKNLPSIQCNETGIFGVLYPFGVLLGENSMATNTDCEKEVCSDKLQGFKIADIIPHPAFSGRPDFRHDIALIKFGRPAQINGWVNTLCLIESHQVNYNPFDNQRNNFIKHTPGIAAGWGVKNPYSTPREYSDELLKLHLPIVSMEKCKDFHKLNVNASQQICVGGVVGKDTCDGDSGGPLMIVVDTPYGPKYHLLGVLSYGQKICGDKPDAPAIYTNYLYYEQWVLNHLG